MLVLGFTGGWLWLQSHAVVPILMYHEVDKKEIGGLNVVTPESFEKQLQYLQKNRFNVVSLDVLVEKLKNGQKLPSKSVVITFDDGFMDNFVYAYPLLKKYNYTATIFIPTDLMETEGYLTWDQIRLMDKDNVTFGSHSRRHKYLPDLTSEEYADEIIVSKKILEEKLGHSIDLFSYPVGGYTPEIQKIVQEAGYKAAFTTNRGKDRFNKSSYELKRIRIKDSDVTDFVLMAKISGYYNLFRKMKPCHVPAGNNDVKGNRYE